MHKRTNEFDMHVHKQKTHNEMENRPITLDNGNMHQKFEITVKLKKKIIIVNL